MGHIVFKLPDIGEGIAESEIALWRVAVGDVVVEDQPLVDMLTDKAAVEIPAPFSGTVVQLHGQVGDRIAVGAGLVTLETGAPGEEPAPARPAVAIEREAVVVSPAASPAVRKRARELGIDLRCVKGSGPSGRIRHEDLDAHRMAASPVPERTRGDVEQVKLIGLRRQIAQAMQRSKQRIPHFAYVEEVDVTELEALRRYLNESRPDRPKLTLLPFVIQALVKAVPSFPAINATFDDEGGIVTRHRALHAGIATQTPHGLVVPVLRNAQQLDLWQRASAIRRLADDARAGKASREDLGGSTLTISSLGALGGVATTPIINAPEVAIVGINKILERPVVRHGQITPRAMMNLSSSFDHRVVDGFDAASFVQRLKSLLEHPAMLFLD